MNYMTFYVTFGQSHPLRNGYVTVLASSYESAREAVFETLGNKWAFIYPDDEDMSDYSLGAVGETIIGD